MKVWNEKWVRNRLLFTDKPDYNVWNAHDIGCFIDLSARMSDDSGTWVKQAQRHSLDSRFRPYFLHFCHPRLEIKWMVITGHIWQFHKNDANAIPLGEVKTNHRRDLKRISRIPMAVHRDSWPILTCYHTQILWASTIIIMRGEFDASNPRQRFIR